MIALKPFMDPQVTTFAQPSRPAADVQRHRRDRHHVLGTDERPHPRENSKYAKQFRVRGAAEVAADSAKLYDALSVDGWSIPNNTAVDKDALFQMIASSVSEEASKASLPAAYPARSGMVSDSSSAYAAAANVSIQRHRRPSPTRGPPT